ncbi:flagellar basal-body MS-ring/collar protein FliF [Alteribacillus sp. HJP-4]|uniref:flagellar basal-body MS-ring/collar protein FliF n=1 Tax=Alteribacillus sp. HJP-4 TaxID=2775394 RepID=UPI0035CD1D93
MKEKYIELKERAATYWSSRSNLQKGLGFGTAAFILLLIVLVIVFAARTNYAPLYSDLSSEETGQIKETLDSQGVPSKLSNDGSTISVPEESVDALKVELAAEGIPQSGSIDYSFIEDQMGFGMTDNEFNVMERAAIQTELEELIQNIDGVQAANVMITLPEETTWVNEEAGTASASVVIDTGGSSNMDQQKVRALYHLVSKSVPDLPVDNIVIMNEMFEDFDYDNENSSDSTMNAYQEQRGVQDDIEKDIQSQLQQMLGTMMGRDKVVVSVTTDIDFTQENREEALIEPVDEENMEGIELSAERITETYEGEAVDPGGIPGADEDDIVGYNDGAVGGEGDFERTEERVNNEVNRIHREIVESPYKLRDLGIQVMVEPPDPEEPDSLPPESIGDIEQVLSTIVRTSIDDEFQEELTDADIEEKVFVSTQTFNGKAELDEEPANTIPVWMYIVGGILLLAVIVLVIALLRKSRETEEEDFITEEMTTMEVPDLPDDQDSEQATRRKQLEKMAKERPEEFSKLLRTWLSDD